MEAKKMKILETLQMQPLSDEEKASRHILGRLYGPIATTKSKTRNGRLYNKELWQRALADDIFKEKIANKCLFLELGHPQNREETDMEKVCACIPEMPKIVDGDLYAYVDILDTNNGRLLKTLCDYGFIPGISSRGSGDIMANDEVDPETFFLETWDIVAVPALREARLMRESLDTKNKKLAGVLRESFNKANAQEKEEMKEALNKLNIKLLEEAEFEDIPWAPEESESNADSDIKEESKKEETDTQTVGNLINQLKEYDSNLEVVWTPITIEGTEYTVNSLVLDDAEKGKLIATIDYNLPKETPEADGNKKDSEDSSEAETAPTKKENESAEAVDNGDEEMFESLKGMVRQKNLLENKVRELNNQKTVSDAEVKRLKEELDKYKSGFIRVSELASKSTKLEKDVKLLEEQLVQRDTKLNELQTKVEKQTRLTESVHANESKVKTLTEQLVSVQTEAEQIEKELKTKLEESSKKVQERTNIAKAYKAKYESVLEHYVASKASMLGVRTTDITSRLAESYTLDDIDQVCEDLLDMGRPAFGLGLGQPKVKINESKSVKTNKSLDPNNGYEIDDDLLILAGLK